MNINDAYFNTFSTTQYPDSMMNMKADIPLKNMKTF